MSDERLHRIVGLVLLPAIALAVGAVLWIGQRPMRPVIHLQAEFDRVGQLQPGGAVRMANMEVGRVKHITFHDRRREGSGRRRVRAYFYVEKRHARQIWTNSKAYISSASLIGERHLEIVAPMEDPARPVRPGDVLEGHSPSHMDRFLQLGYRSLVATEALARAVDPHWSKLRGHLGSVSEELAALKGTEQRLRKMGDRAQATLEEAKESYRTIQAATDDFDAFSHLEHDLKRFGRRAKQGARPLASEAEKLMDRLRALDDLLRKRVPPAIRVIRGHVRGITASFELVERWVGVVKRIIDRGDGTLGAFMKDRELWDDLKASGKVIRQEIWRTITRPEKTTVKDSPAVP